MLKLIIIEDSTDGKHTHQGDVRLEPSAHVHEIEVAAMWASVRNGGLERDVKNMLERFCAERGLNASQLLT